MKPADATSHDSPQRLQLTDRRAAHAGHRLDPSTETMSDNEPDNQLARERYGELLQELRTIIPGAQVLLGFLLTAPFSSRFDDIDRTGRTAYLLALASVAAADILFLAPAAYHRVTHHRHWRQRLDYGVTSTLAGLALLGLSITLAMFVVTRFIYGTTTGTIAAAGTATLATLVWLAKPIHDIRNPPDHNATQHRS